MTPAATRRRAVSTENSVWTREAVRRETRQRPAAGVDRGQDEPAERDEHGREREHHQPSYGGGGDQRHGTEEQRRQPHVGDPHEQDRLGDAVTDQQVHDPVEAAGVGATVDRLGRDSLALQRPLAGARLGRLRRRSSWGCRRVPAPRRPDRRWSRTCRPPGRCRATTTRWRRRTRSSPGGSCRRARSRGARTGPTSLRRRWLPPSPRRWRRSRTSFSRGDSLVPLQWRTKSRPAARGRGH